MSRPTWGSTVFLKMRTFLLPCPDLAHTLGLRTGGHDLYVPSLIARCHCEGLAGAKQNEGEGVDGFGFPLKMTKMHVCSLSG